MMKRQAKGVIALFMAVLTAAGMSATALAQESAETAPKYLPSDVEEITEEIIEEYGILSTDADGSDQEEAVQALAELIENNFGE